MRICKCDTEMEFLGNGRYWCPECGRYSQSYVCEETEWRTPRIIKENENK
jgi:tRNA(Ile2) C34 agmatinyltransferase TiaS